MTWNKLPWGWILAMVYVATAPLVYGTIAFWPQMPQTLHRLGGQTAAAWVQGIGTIVAIFASAGIAMRIDGNAARRLRDERRAIETQHFVDGRDAIVTAIAKVRQARALFDAADGDSAAVDHPPIRKVVSVATALVEHYLSRKQAPADLAFALIYTRNELAALERATEGDASSRSYFALQYALVVAAREIGEVLRQLDAGVLASETEGFVGEQF